MTRPEPDLDAQIESLGTLRDPLRRTIYKFVARSAEPVGRDAVAAAVGASRSLVSFHLEKLAAEGLLRTSFQRLSGRAGPGAGRPAKMYERSDRQLDVTLPARAYEFAAHLLLSAITGKGRGGANDRLQEAAHKLGHATGARDVEEHGVPRSRAASVARVEDVLEQFGYEPFRDGGAVCLRNCPFHALAQQATGVVCGMNLALIDGVLEGMSAKGLEAQLSPAAGRCCVSLRSDAAK